MRSLVVQDVWGWLRDILEPLPDTGNGSEHGNRSADVFCANCIKYPDEVACVRASVVAFLGVLTALFAVVRVFSLHGRRQLSPLKLFLYYLVLIHCVAGSLEWIFGWTTPVTLFISYAKAVELLIVCYFYLDVATRMMQWNTSTGRTLSLTALFLMFSYFTLFVVLGFVLSIEPWTDCHAPYWMWFSLGQLLTVQMMVSSFLIIIHRINHASAAPSIRNTQRTQLLCLLYVYETSAFADVAWHVVMFMLADDHKGCSGIFNHNQLKYSAFKLPYDLVSFLFPVWAILYVFRPTIKPSVDRDENEDRETEDTEEDERVRNVMVVRSWQRRYRPLNTSRSDLSYRAQSEDRNFVDPTRQVRRSRRNNGRIRSGTQPAPRRAASAPSMVPPTRRHSVSRSLISSPLYPIPEEPIGGQQNRVYEDADDEWDHVEERVSVPILVPPPPGHNEAASSIDNASTAGIVDGE